MIEPSIFKGCYWYPSVDAAYQEAKADWEPAVNDASKWLQKKINNLQAA